MFEFLAQFFWRPDPLKDPLLSEVSPDLGDP